MNSELYPIQNEYRRYEVLDGLWKFRFDPEGKGETEKWYNSLKDAISMPVPASFADLFTDAESHDYCGDFWYETSFYGRADGAVPWIRFGSVTHRCTVYLNGIEVGRHEGGYLPVVCNLQKAWKEHAVNRLSVKVNNELNETSLPCGTVEILTSGRKVAKPYFDFFNYSGIHRRVWLEYLPADPITDYDTDFAINGNNADVTYKVYGAEGSKIHVTLLDEDGNKVAENTGREGVLHVRNAHLWQVRNAYLYTIVMDAENDSYQAKLGIRTVKIDGTKILVNNQPVYLKGYGKHEDFDVIGKAFNYAVAKRDFACMEWTNANCFRTSHYPYAEEWYQLADEEGFLIIDEIPAVGMMRSTHNFAAAGKGVFTRFFQADTVPELKKNHILQVQEMIQRDKNHPSVISFSLFNEPETTSSEAHTYFSDIFAYARTLDPEHRPLTGALEKNSSPELCQVYMLCDFICLNRYYGWYISGGSSDIEEAEIKFRDEMDRWQAKNLHVPFVFTEFGTDTMPGQHNLPGIMWSEEYQKNYYDMNFRVFDSYNFVQGELTWNFADFATSEGIMRVNGNRKGVFTRERQPKSCAFLLKERWNKM